MAQSNSCGYPNTMLHIFLGACVRRGRFLLWLLLFGMPIAHGATIVVAATDGVIDGNGGTCSISEAIQNANDDAMTNADCVAGSGADTIQLTKDVTLAASVDSTEGSNGTPSVTTAITLDGQGYRVARAALTCNLDGTNDAPEFRLFYIGAAAPRFFRISTTG